MAIAGVSSNMSGVTGSSGAGPKVQESPVGVFDRILEKMKNSIGMGSSSEATKGSSSDVENLRLNTTHFKSDLQQKLLQSLLEHGIDLSQPFTLREDGFGGVQVVGNHSDKQAIEQIFEEDSGLRQDFAQLASNAARLHAADQSAFQTGTSPQSGTADSGGGGAPAFSLIVRDGTTEMAFLRS